MGDGGGRKTAIGIADPEVSTKFAVRGLLTTTTSAWKTMNDSNPINIGESGQALPSGRSPQGYLSGTEGEAKADLPSSLPPFQSNGHGRVVVFRMRAPGAKRVQLAADFSQWDRSPLDLYFVGDHFWQITLSLPPGRYCYRFIVDGEWRDDPWCPHRESNTFGGHNAVVEVR